MCWWWGCLHSADLWSRRRCTSSAPKETEDSRMKGGVRQRKQKKEEEQSKSEVWKFVEVLKVLKMDCHSVVGSGNYWVTFVAQSQFVLIRCLWTLILKAWRPLRVGASSSIDGGSEFQVLTYPWGNDRAIVAFERTGRSRESRNEWLSESWCLVLGLSTGVSWAGSRGWSVVRRGPLSSLYRRHRALTVRRRARLSMMVPAPMSDRARF